MENPNNAKSNSNLPPPDNATTNIPGGENPDYNGIINGDVDNDKTVILDNSTGVVDSKDTDLDDYCERLLEKVNIDDMKKFLDDDFRLYGPLDPIGVSSQPHDGGDSCGDLSQPQDGGDSSQPHDGGDSFEARNNFISATSYSNQEHNRRLIPFSIPAANRMPYGNNYSPLYTDGCSSGAYHCQNIIASSINISSPMTNNGAATANRMINGGNSSNGGCSFGAYNKLMIASSSSHSNQKQNRRLIPFSIPEANRIHYGDNYSLLYTDGCSSGAYHRQNIIASSINISSPMTNNGAATANRMINGGNSSNGGCSFGAYNKLMIASSSSHLNQEQNRRLIPFSIPDGGSFGAYNQLMIASSSSDSNQAHNRHLNPINISSPMTLTGATVGNSMINGCSFYNGGGYSGEYNQWMIPTSQAYHSQNMMTSSNIPNLVHCRPLNPINSSLIVHNGAATANGMIGGGSSGIYNQLMISSPQAYRLQNMISSSSNSNQMQNGRDNIVNNNISVQAQRVVNLVPLDFRFAPTDLELVQKFLMRKVNGQPLPSNIIPTFFVYSMSPSKLTAMFNSIGDSEWYFFSKRNKKYRTRNTPDRANSEGFWRVIRGVQRIPREPPILAVKNSLHYYIGNYRQAQKTEWKMDEFVLADHLKTSKFLATIPENEKQLDECVLCRIYD